MNDMGKLVGEARSKVFFDKLREQISTFIGREAKLLEVRKTEFEAAEKSVKAAVGNIANSKAEAKIEAGLKIMQGTQKWVVHTFEVIGRANATLAAAVDMETGMRGYLLAGQNGFLDPYNSGNRTFHDLVAGLRETVSDNPAQVKLLDEMKTTIGGWVKDVTEPTIALRRKVGSAKTMDDMADFIGETRGKKYFDGFRQIMADFSAEEQGLMVVRQTANEEKVSSTYIIIAACIALALAIGGFLA